MTKATRVMSASLIEAKHTEEFAERLQYTSPNRESDFFAEIERTNKESDL